MAKEKTSSGNNKHISGTFKLGVVSLAFIILGYEAALFMHRSAELRIAAIHVVPDTVYVIDSALAARLLSESTPEREGQEPRSVQNEHPSIVIRKESHNATAPIKARGTGKKRAETFRFNPNTASIDDFIRLGFSEKQALALDSYRSKRGRFHRKSDFASSYVVADSVYKRLEAFIDIPLVDINTADSAAFDALPGIGGWFASRMVTYRNELGGYSFPEQLMDIYRFDSDRFKAISDLITITPPKEPFRIWTLDEEGLRRHPYIRSWHTAHAIVLYRKSMPRESWTIDGLKKEGILNEEDALKLSRCYLEDYMSLR